MLQLGDRVDNYSSESTHLYFFVSEFCSKCHYNRTLLSTILEAEKMTEINIVRGAKILEKVRPRMTPSIVVINPEGLVVFSHEGVLTDLEASSLPRLF